MRHALISILVAAACSGTPATPPAPAPAPAEPAPAPAPTPAPVDPAADLPPEAAPVTAAALAEQATCGPFRTKDIDRTDHPLLGDRLRVHFVPKGQSNGGSESDKIQAERGDVALFVGARETYQHGDELFARKAAKQATFGGTYDAVTLPGRDGKLSIVTGLLQKANGDDGLVALAHGWFLDKNQDVLDVAVFASKVTSENLAQCRLLAKQLIATVAEGPRALAYGTGKEATTKVSYVTFTYKLPSDWLLTGWEGIHDFAHIHFKKRAVYPAEPTFLRLGLDSHPGDWKSDGEEKGTRQGTLFGVPVTWHLTQGDSVGGWTLSTDLRQRDHAVASITAASEADRDAAIEMAASISAGK